MKILKKTYPFEEYKHPNYSFVCPRCETEFEADKDKSEYDICYTKHYDNYGGYTIGTRLKTTCPLCLAKIIEDYDETILLN